jgi:hypothetical protein
VCYYSVELLKMNQFVEINVHIFLSL